MRKLLFAPSASEDLTSIYDYIAKHNPSAALQWIDKIKQKCELLISTPFLGEKRAEFGSEVRSTYVGRYIIFYRPTDTRIEIVRVIAGDRDIRVL